MQRFSKLCKDSQRLVLPSTNIANGHYKATLFCTYLLEARYEDTRCNYFTALRIEVFLSDLTTVEHLHRSTTVYLTPGRCFQSTQLLPSDPEESLPPTHKASFWSTAPLVKARNLSLLHSTGHVLNVWIACAPLCKLWLFIWNCTPEVFPTP